MKVKEKRIFKNKIIIKNWLDMENFSAKYERLEGKKEFHCFISSRKIGKAFCSVAGVISFWVNNGKEKMEILIV